MTRWQVERPRRRSYGSLEAWKARCKSASDYAARLQAAEPTQWVPDVRVTSLTLEEGERILADRGRKLRPRREVHDCPVGPVDLIVSKRGRIHVGRHTTGQLVLNAMRPAPGVCNCDQVIPKLVCWERLDQNTTSAYDLRKALKDLKGPLFPPSPAEAVPAMEKMRALQRALGVPADGVWGPNTSKALLESGLSEEQLVRTGLFVNCPHGYFDPPFVDHDWTFLPSLSRNERRDRWKDSVRERMPRFARLCIKNDYQTTREWYRRLYLTGLYAMGCNVEDGEGVYDTQHLYDNNRRRPGYRACRLLIAACRRPDDPSKLMARLILIGVPAEKLEREPFHVGMYEMIQPGGLERIDAMMCMAPVSVIRSIIDENINEQLRCVW